MKPKELPPLPENAPGKPDKDPYKRQFGVIVLCEDVSVQKTVFEGLKAIGAKLKVVST